MYIIFRTIGHVIVDHVRNICHIDAPCGNIRRDQYSERPSPETFQRGAALRQGAPPVQHCYAMTG
jgi:hypothetical protein